MSRETNNIYESDVPRDLHPICGRRFLPKTGCPWPEEEEEEKVVEEVEAVKGIFFCFV